MNSLVYSKVLEIIAEYAVLDIEDVGPESTLEELGIDSLGLVESIFALEEYFDIQIPFNANDIDSNTFDFSNVASIVDGIEKLTSPENC